MKTQNSIYDDAEQLAAKVAANDKRLAALKIRTANLEARNDTLKVRLTKRQEEESLMALGREMKARQAADLQVMGQPEPTERPLDFSGFSEI